MFLKHAGKFLFQQDRWNMINLNSCRRSTSFNSAWSSPCLWCEDWQHLFDFEKEFSIIKDNFKKSPTSLKPFESIKGKGWLGSTLCLPWTSEAFYALPKKQQWSTGSHLFLWKLQMNNYHFELGSIVSEAVEENCLCWCVWDSFDSFCPGPFLP